MVHFDAVIQIEVYPQVGVMAQEIVKSRKLNLFFLEEVKLFLQLIARRGRRGGLGLFFTYSNLLIPCNLLHGNHTPSPLRGTRAF